VRAAVDFEEIVDDEHGRGRERDDRRDAAKERIVAEEHAESLRGLRRFDARW